jgi:hypothetical protein
VSTKPCQDPFPNHTGLPSANDETLFFARSMTELAHILKQTSDEIYHIGSTSSRQDKSEAALRLDKKLVRWKEDISPVFDMENNSLTERESSTKRKVVLKLRKSRKAMLKIHIDRSRFLQCTDSDTSSIPSRRSVPRRVIFLHIKHTTLCRGR